MLRLSLKQWPKLKQMVKLRIPKSFSKLSPKPWQNRAQQPALLLPLQRLLPLKHQSLLLLPLNTLQWQPYLPQHLFKLLHKSQVAKNNSLSQLTEHLTLISKLLWLPRLKRLLNSNNRMANQLTPQLLLLQSRKLLDKSIQLLHQQKLLSQQPLLSNQQLQSSPNSRSLPPHNQSQLQTLWLRQLSRLKW